MWTCYKYRLDENENIIDFKIIAIGDKKHCISKCYDDYNTGFDELSLEEIEQRLDLDNLRKWHDPDRTIYKMNEV